MSNAISKNTSDTLPAAAPHGRAATARASGITWGAGSAIIVALAVYLLAQLIAVEIVGIYPTLRHWTTTHANNWLTNSVYGQFFYVLLAEVLTVSLIVAFIHWRKGSFRALGLKRPKWEDIAYALSGFLAYFIIYIVAVSVLSAVFKGLNVSQSQDVGFSGSYTGWQLFLVFVSLVVLPPIAEEFMFRGFLYSGLKKSLPKVWAMLATSVVFAAPHLLESSGGGLLWIAGIDTFVLSLVLCYLRDKTGRLSAGMGLHALKNFVAFASLYLLHVH